MTKIYQAILRTLVYADVFDYPLSSAELYRFLITDEPLSYVSFKQALGRIETNGEFFFLKGRAEIVARRKERARWSREKLRQAQKVTGWLRLIPWVKMVGVTGSLAILNSDEADDIDILIVCSRGKLWLTRLASVLLLELLGKRRRPGDRQVRDKICLNMFLEEEHLTVPKKEQDIFSAHEVCQLKILWEKEKTGEKFYWQNRWVRKYLPNAISLKPQTLKVLSFGLAIGDLILAFFEKPAKVFQLWYMAKRRTTEMIAEGILRFHPDDARNWVLKKYHLRLQKLGLDKF